MSDLPADWSDGDVLDADDVNLWKGARDGDMLPINATTRNHDTAGNCNLGSGTYYWGVAYAQEWGAEAGATKLSAQTWTTEGVNLDTATLTTTNITHGLSTAECQKIIGIMCSIYGHYGGSTETGTPGMRIMGANTGPIGSGHVYELSVHITDDYLQVITDCGSGVGWDLNDHWADSDIKVTVLFLNRY